MEEVEYIQSHGKSDTKLLRGRELFLSKEIHSLSQTGEQLIIIPELCVLVCDMHNDIVDPYYIRALLRNQWLKMRKPKRLSPGYYLWDALYLGYETYQILVDRECWNDYVGLALPFQEFLQTRYCIMHPGLAVIEHQPFYQESYAGEDNFIYLAGERMTQGLEYQFKSARPTWLPPELAASRTSITAKEINPQQWELTLSIPNSAFAQGWESGTFLHQFLIYGRRTWSYVYEWRIISGESCYAQDGSPPGTYDYLIYPQTLVKTTLP